MKKFSIIFLTLFLISIVSANGLTITSNSDFNITKEQDIDKLINLTIYNSEPFDFYNIKPKNDDIITMTEIPILLSGQSINITATLNKNNNFNGEIEIRGDYNTTIGASNKTEVIKISYNNGFDKCNLDLVKGDSVIWINEDLDEVKLKNTDTNEYFTTINENENYTKVFSESIVLNYLAVWLVPFTDICQINVQNDSGLVHKSEYDAKINLDLNINYKNTTIETTFLTTSYSLDYNQNKEDVFAIKNTGNETAYIKLSSDNIVFSNDNFNLNAGDSINVDYEIKPFVTKTNDTNKTYNKLIKIKGNFPTLTKNISVYINYANLDNIITDGEIDFEYWGNLFNLICISNPNEPKIKKFCQNFQNNNNNLNSSRKLGDGWELIFLERYGNDLINSKDFRKLMLENEKTKTDIDTNQTKALESLLISIKEMEKTSNNSSMVSLFLIVLIGSGIFFTIIIYLIRNKLSELKINKSLGIYKREKWT